MDLNRFWDRTNNKQIASDILAKKKKRKARIKDEIAFQSRKKNRGK